MNILVVEDDPFVLKEMLNMLELLGYSNMLTADNYDDAISLVNEHEPNIALLDIQIVGDKNGIEIGRYLNKIGIPFIYLSDVQDLDTFALAKATSPSANLDKPVSLIRLRNAISIGVSSSNESKNEEQHIIVPTSKGKIKILASEIIFLKASQNNCEIHLENHKFNRLLSSTPMGNVVKVLDNADFCQVHRSYVVNLNKVVSFQGRRVFFDQEREIEVPIGLNHLSNFKSRFKTI
ncbi:MAG: response regulator [Crocinitomix sp.]|nr:response regulator [Crocinitomix sp.]